MCERRQHRYIHAFNRRWLTPLYDPLMRLAMREAIFKPALRVLPGMPGELWYREAHNDWVQLLVETGVLGLAIGLWAAASILWRPGWLPWAIGPLAVMIHGIVEFNFQIPAIPVLVVVMATVTGVLFGAVA